MKYLLLLTVLALLLFAGCRDAGPGASTAEPPVRVLAYINVTSGCQQATVDLLRSQAAANPRLEVELVDFGDGGAGAQRWQDSGHKCMTIEINGTPNVKFPAEQGLRVVSFRMPAGFAWEHPDLEAALQAALNATLQAATEEEVLEAMGGAMPDPPKPKKPLPAPRTPPTTTS